jgi:hypothetical protein
MLAVIEARSGTLYPSGKLVARAVTGRPSVLTVTVGVAATGVATDWLEGNKLVAVIEACPAEATADEAELATA